ncbi:Gfo/Idh/MocA family protein [Paenibacillus nasutitermitis]|uniref:Dehydrogenase n=1 Tax=Paenibacillus nasutitermitis TaxID=1652958 RepID=A0A916YIS7_9BACL|nr:Gfo/Idh/MocA family oxidoreductase [Paenibacillus nasutitermitis]GGD47344.1 dehydrogenase [Paenibacillus nasutitermitis]
METNKPVPQQPLKLGLIGLDTSHVTAFAGLLNDRDHPYHVPGGTIVAAYPGIASKDFRLSYNRIEQFTEEIRTQHGIAIEESVEALAERCDAMFIESVDGRVHLDIFRRVAPYGKPVFIDKPFTLNSKDAEQIVAIANQYSVPVMSCSSLRYAEGLLEQLTPERQAAAGPIIGADCYGPMMIEQTQPGLFWYGIHSVEMLYRIMGQGCISISAVSNEDHDLIIGRWKDGRIGTIRGNRSGNSKFGALIHREQETDSVDVYANPKPYYASMLERVIEMFHTRQSDIPSEETIEIIRFIERANECRLSGNPGERAL